MYKLLLVSDQEDVLDAFDRVDSWEYNGFHRPHIRHDVEGAKESLRRHHADGIGIALEPEAERELMEYLQAEYPVLPIFEAGRTPTEVMEYLSELRTILNRVRADFSSDSFDEQQLLLRARRYLFRRLVGGEKVTRKELGRNMRLLRSRMDPDKPCILMDLQKSSTEEDRLVGRWQDSDHLLERELFQSFGGDVKGFHVLPLVTDDGRVFVLAGALRGQEQQDDMVAALDQCVQAGIAHAEEYRGIHLRVTGVQVLPTLYAFCSDYGSEG